MEALAKENLYKAPALEEAEILEKFKTASQIGRNYDTRIGGQKIYRDEISTILNHINAKKRKGQSLLPAKKGVARHGFYLNWQIT